MEGKEIKKKLGGGEDRRTLQCTDLKGNKNIDQSSPCDMLLRGKGEVSVE